ncbi:hypothetical protein BGZ65_010422, partial [Modicella reniformis]
LHLMVPRDSWDQFEEYGIEEPRLTKRNWDEIDDLCYEHASPTVRQSEAFKEARAKAWLRIKEAARIRCLNAQADTRAEVKTRLRMSKSGERTSNSSARDKMLLQSLSLLLLLFALP